MVARKNPTPQELQQQQQEQGQSVAHMQLHKRGPGQQQQGLRGVGSDVIFSERRGQSQKPEEIYELIESLVPCGEQDRGGRTRITNIR